MAKEFPVQKIEGDVYGSGTSAELVQALGEGNTSPVEIRLRKREKQGHLEGSFGHLQYVREKRVTMSIVFIANEDGSGLEVPSDLPASRTQLELDSEIEWVIHPPLK